MSGKFAFERLFEGFGDLTSAVTADPFPKYHYPGLSAFLRGGFREIIQRWSRRLLLYFFLLVLLLPWVILFRKEHKSEPIRQLLEIHEFFLLGSPIVRWCFVSFLLHRSLTIR